MRMLFDWFFPRLAAGSDLEAGTVSVDGSSYRITMNYGEIHLGWIAME